MVKEKKIIKSTIPQAKAVEKTVVINHRLLGMICAFFAFILYINTVSYDYMVDDATVIKNNKITTQGVKAIPTIFSSAYRAGFWARKEGLYRPLSVAMFAIEWQVAPDQPWLSHLINVLLYTLTAWVLFNLLRKIFKKYHSLIPFFITLLYIVLPVHTEVVANIKSRDEILCFLFLIVSMQQLYNWLGNTKPIILFFSLLSFFLALLSKESAITFVAVIPLFAYFFTAASKKQLFIISGTFLFTALCFMGLRYSVIGVVGGTNDIQLINNSLMGATDKVTQLATAIYILGKYLLLMLVPVKLIFDYSYNAIPLVTIGSFKALVSIGVYAVLVWYAVKTFTKRNPVSFGIIFFLITISLVSNILFFIEATLAERFLYIPSLGYCIAAVLALSMLFKKKLISTGSLLKQIKSNTVFMLLTVFILVYSVRTIARNMDWKDNITLLAKDVQSAPNSARIRYAYGSAILVEQALKENDKSKKMELLAAAINQLEKGVALIDDYAEAWYHLGLAYKESDDAGNAVRAFEKARSFKPFDETEKLIATGLAYGMAQQYDKAIADFKQALLIDPKSTEAMNNLGLYYNEANMINESIDILKRAIQVKPDFKTAYYNLGNTIAKSGNYRGAMDYYLGALKIDAGYSDALNNIGNCYSVMEMRDSARYYYEKAVASDANNVKALVNMGVSLNQMGDTANAKIWIEKARALGANI